MTKMSFLAATFIQLFGILAVQVRSQDDYAEIDFQSHLSVFKDCGVHFVFNDVKTLNTTKQYFIKALEFPIVLSRNHYKTYKLADNKRIDYGDFTCDGGRLSLADNDGFLFNAPPAHKLRCFAQIYIAPRSCKKWNRHDRYIYGNLVTLAPVTNMQVIFDYRIGDENLSTTKCCVFYIHVEMLRSSKTTQKVASKQRLHYFDTFKGRKTPPVMYANPTQLSFEISYHKRSESFKLLYTQILTCANFLERILKARKLCSTLKQDWVTRKENSLRNILQGLKPFQKIVKYHHKTMSSLNAINALRLSCPNILLGYTGGFTKSLSPNMYLSQWKTGGFDVEPIFLQMLFPNLTLLTETAISFLNTRIPAFLTGSFVASVTEFSLSTRYDSIMFVTCVPIKKPSPLSLDGYVSAFDLATWLVFAGLLTGSVITWNVINTNSKHPTFPASWRNISVGFFYKILLGQSTDTIKYVRWVTGSWVFAGMFLNYNYQGSNIDQLTAPLSSKKIETFKELFEHNLTLYSLPIEQDLWRELLFQTDEDVLAEDTRWDADQVNFAECFRRRNINLTEKDSLSQLTTLIKTPQNLVESRVMFRFDYYVNKISKCEKDAFVDSFANVNKLYLQLRKIGIDDENIAVSKSSYGTAFQNMGFKNFKYLAEPVATRFSLFQSGLMELWKTWQHRIETWNDTLSALKNHTEFYSPTKAISTRDNIVVVFYVHLSLQLISLLFFIYECKLMLMLAIVNCVIWSFTMLKKCYSFCRKLYGSLCSGATKISVCMFACLRHFYHKLTMGYTIRNSS